MTDLKTEFIIIGKEKDSFIESYIGEPLLETDKNEYFLIVIELLHKFLEGETIAEAITETFRKNFYQSNELDNFRRFEDALKAVNKEVNKLETESGLSLKNINIAIVALVGNELLLSQSNDAEVYLIRKGYLSVVSEGLSNGYAKPGEDLFKNISSGNLNDGDQVLLCSGRVLRYITKTEFGKMFYGKNLETGLTNLQDALTTEVLGRLGILGMTYLPIPKDVTQLEQNQGATGDLPPSNLIEKLKNTDFQQVKQNLVNYKTGAKKVLDFFNFIPEKKHNQPTQQPGPTETVNENLDLNAAIDLSNHDGANANIVETQSDFNPRQTIAKLVEFTKLKLAQKELNLNDKTIKLGLIGGGVLAVLLILFIITRGAQLAQISKYEDIFTQARNQIAAAKNTDDKLNADNILKSAESSLKEALDAKYVQSEASRILAEIKAARFEFDQVTLVENPDLVVDLSEVSEADNANFLIKTTVALFAINSTEFIEILLDSAKDPIEIGKLKIKDVTYLSDLDSAFALTESGSIYSYTDGEIKNAQTDSDQKHNLDAIAGFGDRLYAIDNKAQQIWKFNTIGGELEPKEAYLKDNKLPEAKDIAIDGSVYVLTENNQIVRYFGGKISNFKVTDAPLVELTNPERIYTELDSSSLYVLDPAERRVLVYFKNQRTSDLDYVRQYVFPSIGEITDFYADESSKKLYLLAENSIYVTDLR